MDIPRPDAEPVQDPQQALKSDISTTARLCRQALKRLNKKQEKQELELAGAQSWEHLRQSADTILNNAGSLRKGQSSCELLNAHTGMIETITLNPALTPHENAELYYRKAKKGKRGLEIIQDIVKQTAQEIKTIGTALAALERLSADATLSVETAVERLEQIKDRIPLVVPASRGVVQSKAQQAEKTPYRKFTFDGWEIFVGRNDAQNDELSTRFAKPWDIWLHVAAHPGSHVVIRRQKNTEWPPKRIIETAAAFAVWFSKAKHTTYAEVHVTERRFVSKRRHSPPGQVMLQQFKSVRVAPKSPQEFFKDYAGETGDDWS